MNIFWLIISKNFGEIYVFWLNKMSFKTLKFNLIFFLCYLDLILCFCYLFIFVTSVKKKNFGIKFNIYIQKTLRL